MENEKLVWKVVKMLHQRALHEQRKGDIGRWSAYQSAHDMLLYALDGNEDCLRQFDYYREEE